MLSLDALKLDGNLLSGYDVGAEVDIAERTTTDLTTDAVLIADAKILLRSQVSMLLSKRVWCNMYREWDVEIDKLARGCDQATGDRDHEPSRFPSGTNVWETTRRHSSWRHEEREYKPEGWISTWKRVDSP